MFDGPGQGGALKEYGLPIDFAWEKPAKAILDFFKVDNVIWLGAPFSNLSLFAEKVGVGRFTYRFEVDNLLDQETCRERRRFNGYLRNGDIREIERFCTTNGVRFTFKVRATF